MTDHYIHLSDNDIVQVFGEKVMVMVKKGDTHHIYAVDTAK